MSPITSNALPRIGDVIIFRKPPVGSWISIGEEYIVERGGKDYLYFRNIKTGGGTFDGFWNIKQSEFTIVRSAE